MRHTFLNLGKRERNGSKRLVKHPSRSFSRTALSLFLSLSPHPPPLSHSPSNYRHPRIFLCASLLPMHPHPRHGSRTHDAMANDEWTTHAPDMIFFLLSRHPRSIPPLVRRGVALVVGSTGRRGKGVATGNANELHERRQIEQHITMVSSCHPLAFARANLVPPSNGVTTNLIESCLCINTAAYVVIDGCALRNGMSRTDQCAFLRDLNVVLFPVLSFKFLFKLYNLIDIQRNEKVHFCIV